MNCLKCGSKSKVIDNRKRKWSMYNRLRRRRECTKCKHRFTTYEYYEVDSLHKHLIEKELEELDTLMRQISNKVTNYRTKKIQNRRLI